MDAPLSGSGSRRGNLLLLPCLGLDFNFHLLPLAFVPPEFI
jgi:hypothetical protein